MGEPPGGGWEGRLLRVIAEIAAALAGGAAVGYWLRAGPPISDNAATLLAGLGGAGLGGFVSFFIAKKTTQTQLERDREDRLNRDRSAALTVLVNTMQIANRLFTFNGHLTVAVAPSPEPPWQRLQASPEQEPAPLRYQAADFAPFVEAEKADLVHRAFLLSERLESLEASFRAYVRFRLKLEEMLVPHSTFHEGQMITKCPPEILSTIHYYTTQLDGLIASMHKYCVRDLADANALVDDMNAACKAIFGPAGVFELKRPDDAQATDNDTAGRAQT